jgi:putative hemolysin
MVAVFERTSKRARRAARLLAVASAFAAAAPVVAAIPVAVAIPVALGAIAAVAPATATAGEYHVYACRTPSGESAPTDGWSGSNTGTAALTEETCAQPGGALVAALRAQRSRNANTTYATWTFAVPAGETLTQATLWLAGDTAGGAWENGSYEFWVAGPNTSNMFDGCVFVDCPVKGEMGQPLSAENRVTVPPANLGSHLYVTAACVGGDEFPCPNGSGDSNGYAAVVYVYAADLILEQSAPPSASNVSGELASAATVGGTSDVAFSASDPGSGVYEAVFSVDGQVVQSTVVDEDGGRCRNVGQTTDGLAAFLYVQPCPASLNADVGFDTTRVGNGEHHLVVSVIDAAGNAATVLDRNVTIYNPPPVGGPNGTNASAHATLAVGWQATRSTRLASGYRRAQTIAGRLTGTGGVPIGAAQVNVLTTPDYAGARAAVTSVLTSAEGRFTLRVPAGSSSRTLRFEYSDDLGAPPVATRTLTLSVRAGVVLGVAPRTASVGSSIHFSGRLLGGPVPAGGKLLVLEARSPGGAWLEFDVIRSDARGRFHARYRFKFPGPAKYQFRALCEAEADYPFATGGSNVVGVFER